MAISKVFGLHLNTFMYIVYFKRRKAFVYHFKVFWEHILLRSWNLQSHLSNPLYATTQRIKEECLGELVKTISEYLAGY